MKKNNFFWFWLLTIFSLFLLLLGHWPIGKVIQSWLGKPVLAAEKQVYVFKLAVGRQFAFFTSSRRQEKKIQMLEAKIRQLAVNQNKLVLCQEENEKMRRLLGAPLPPSWKFLPAKVIGLSGRMMINKGEKDGVKKGMMVVSENILVGRVVQVSLHDSFVELPSSPASKIPVIVKRTSAAGVQARGILSGRPAGLVLGNVLQAEDIRKGDLVVTSGEIAGWLPDLLIGQIDEVLTKPAEIYKKARVSPLVDYKNLRIVFLITS